MLHEVAVVTETACSTNRIEKDEVEHVNMRTLFAPETSSRFSIRNCPDLFS
jgi:hypothetical protein